MPRPVSELTKVSAQHQDILGEIDGLEEAWLELLRRLSKTGVAGAATHCGARGRRLIALAECLLIILTVIMSHALAGLKMVVRTPRKFLGNLV